jgi:hypothetical protein
MGGDIAEKKSPKKVIDVCSIFAHIRYIGKRGKSLYFIKSFYIDYKHSELRRNKMKKIGVLLTIFLIMVFVYVCSKSPTSTQTPELSSEQSTTSTSDSDEDTDTGTTTGIIQIILTDNPLEDAKHVYVTIDQIRIHMASEESWKVVSERTREFDLLRLKRNPQLIVEKELNIGHYNQIRLSVVSGKVIIDEGGVDAEYALKITSGEIKIPIQLWIEEDGKTQVTLDFDAEKSVKFHKKGKKNEFTLRPVIKVLKVTTS